MNLDMIADIGRWMGMKVEWVTTATRIWMTLERDDSDEDEQQYGIQDRGNGVFRVYDGHKFTDTKEPLNIIFVYDTITVDGEQRDLYLFAGGANITTRKRVLKGDVAKELVAAYFRDRTTLPILADFIRENA